MDSERDNTSVSNEDSEEDEELVVSSTAHQVKCAETKLKPDISLESSLPCDPLQLEPYTTNGDPEQLERDKQAVYSHPMFPLLALLYEKCEIATQSINSFDRDSSLSSFNNEIEEFIEHQKRLGKPFFTNNAEVDSLMIRAIQVFRIHLLELEKVSELCKDFCQRYISCLRTKMRSDVLIRGGSSSDGNEMMSSVSFEDKETRVLLNELNHNLFASYPGSFTSSVSSCTSSSASSRSSQITSSHVVNSPPSSPSLSHCSSNTGQMQDSDGKSPEARSPSSPSPPPPSQLALTLDPVISTLYNFPLAAKYNLSLAGLTDTIPTESSFQSFLTPEDGIVQDLSLKNKSTSSSQSSPLREPNLFQPVADKSTCNGSSAHQPNVKLTSTKGSKRGDKMSSGVHSKRGVLPKQATSIMRSWLFQHIVHPYPTEDEKRAIASQTNLTLLQVNNWFINARRRILQPMLDSANTLHGELINNNGRELDLSLKIKASGANSRKLKAQSQQLHRLWPQSLANLIQTGDLNPKS